MAFYCEYFFLFLKCTFMRHKSKTRTSFSLNDSFPFIVSGSALNLFSLFSSHAHDRKHAVEYWIGWDWINEEKTPCLLETLPGCEGCKKNLNWFDFPSKQRERKSWCNKKISLTFITLRIDIFIYRQAFLAVSLSLMHTLFSSLLIIEHYVFYYIKFVQCANLKQTSFCIIKINYSACLHVTDLWKCEPPKVSVWSI